MTLYEEARTQNSRLLGALTRVELGTPGDETMLRELEEEVARHGHLRTQHLYPLCQAYPEVRGIAARCERLRHDLEGVARQIASAPDDRARARRIAAAAEHARKLAEIEERELFPAARYAIPATNRELVERHHAAE